MDTHSQLSLQKNSEDIISIDPNRLKSRVAEEALTCKNVEYFFIDLLNNGCQCGMIDFLMYILYT